MKLPKGHIIKTYVKYNMKLNSFEEFIYDLVSEFDGFTGYTRMLADKGDYEEELKAIFLNGELIGGERKLINSGTVFYGNDCKFESAFEFIKCGASIVRLTNDSIDIIKISHPECIIVNDTNQKEPEETNHRNMLLKKYRIKEMTDSEITKLLEKLNGD